MNKKLYSKLLFLFVSLFVLFSCNDEEDIRTRFNLSTISVEVISTGQNKKGEIPVIDVIANKGYSVESDSEWLTVDKPKSNASATIQVLVEKYESGTGRTGILTISTEGMSQQVVVKQTAAPFPAYGYEYFYDDFSWITTYAEKLGAGDYIATADPSASAPNVGSKSQGTNPDPTAVAFMEEFATKGYSVVKPEDNTMYLQTHYLKFGKTDHNNGLILPMIDLNETGEATTDLELSFDFAGHMSGYSYIDDIRMVVEVTGGGKVLRLSGEMSEVSDTFVPDQNDGEAKWTNASVKIYGLTSASKITIRHQDLSEKGVHRFHLDNIKMVKIPGIKK